MRRFLTLAALCAALASCVLFPHTTTGPTTPSYIHPSRYTTLDAVIGEALLGDHIIAGVPNYSWRDGCGPTAVGMVIGYYDAYGWPDLVPGSAVLDGYPQVEQMIASHSVLGEPRHYEDYSLPKDTVPGVAEHDKSELPLGDEHASDSVADFMHTSFSRDGLQYGMSYIGMAQPALTGYFALHYPQAVMTTSILLWSEGLFAALKAEVDTGRPMVMAVDTSADGRADHMVCAIGYRESNGYPEYACYDTYDQYHIRWAPFQPPSSSYRWGVHSITTFKVEGIAPTLDLIPPVTTYESSKKGYGSLTATDIGSGVAVTRYSFDGLAWYEGTSFRFPSGKRTIWFYSVDVAGNVEATKTATR